MRTILTISILVLSSMYSLAQSFSVDVNPKEASLMVGQTTQFTITVTPSGGFAASVFLSTTGSLSSSLSQVAVNAPYQPVQLSVKAGTQDTGMKLIDIVGSNGSLRASAQCTVRVAKNSLWSKVASPRMKQTPTLRFDADGNIMTFSTDSRNTVYAHHYRNMKRQTDTINTGLSNMTFHGVGADGCYDRLRNLYLKVGSGVLMYDGTFFTLYNSSNSDLPFAFPETMNTDPDGNIVCVGTRESDKAYVISTLTNGVWKNRIPTVPIDLSTHHEVYLFSSLCFDSTGHIWIPTQRGGAIRLNPDGTQTDFNPTNSGLKNSIVWSITCDSKGDLTFLHPYASAIPILSSKYDGTSWSFIAAPVFNQSYTPSALVIDADYSTWASSNYGLHHVVGTTQYSIFDKNNSPLPSNDVRLHLQDKNGNLWMSCTYLDGYYVYNPNGLVGIPLLQSTSVGETNDASLQVYPNPGQFEVSVTGALPNAPVTICDVQGRELIQSHTDETGRCGLYVGSMQNGVYICRCGNLSAMISIVH